MEKSPAKDDMTFDEWLTYGVTRYWSSAPICETHDGRPDTSEYKKNDECFHYMLIYKNSEVYEDMRENFPPSYWRIHTRKLNWNDEAEPEDY